jgi:SAM-dependent methyltransferase
MTQPSPDQFLDALLGYQKTAALKAALALDLFTAVAAEGGAVARIAACTGAAERGVRILCDYLTVQGFLAKVDGRYRVTESTAIFLTTTSPAYMGSVADFLAAPEMMALWLADPVSFVRNGGSPGLANIAPENPVWVKFARAMVPFIGPVAQGLVAEIARQGVKPRRVLDVAAGHGMFGIAVARAFADAEITAIDWPAVLAVARENAGQAGVAARHRGLPGSAFDVDWGTGFDLVLLTNFLHHFDPETCVGLLKRARASLVPGGRALAIDMVPNPDRVSPPMPAMFPFMMLASTPRGDAYTEQEYAEMGRAAGFARTTVTALAPTPQSVITFE